MLTLPQAMGPGRRFHLLGSPLTHVKNGRLLGLMKSKANSKAKILIFVSVTEIIQVFTVLLLLIRIRFSCT